MAALKIAIVTCSDTRTLVEDTAGAALVELCEGAGWEVVAHSVVVDDFDLVAEELRRLADIMQADVILTCGGTGFGLRDITPEATQWVCDRMAPGIAEAIRIGSLEITRRAMLSRGSAGLRGRTLIVNFPGSKKAAVESFGFVADQFEHAVDMIAGGGH